MHRTTSLALAALLLFASVLVTPNPAIIHSAADDGPLATYTDPSGNPHTFTVPSGVTQIQIVACGARGGDGGTVGDGQEGGLGGDGGQASKTLTVKPGDTFTVNVGGRGGDGAKGDGESGGGGGVNGGADGGDDEVAYRGGLTGGGGGGASDVRQGGTTLAKRIVVGAGGGGGSGYSTGLGGLDGGDGGGTTGGNGGPSGNPVMKRVGGKGGTLTAGGAGGSANFGESGTPGGLGVGGSGGGAGFSTAGGGGGGYYGGGGGAADDSDGDLTPRFGEVAGGGGGGSSLGDSTTANTACGNSGNGKVTFTDLTPPDFDGDNDAQGYADEDADPDDDNDGILDGADGCDNSVGGTFASWKSSDGPDLDGDGCKDDVEDKDDDGDGFDAKADGGNDCDDTNANIKPGATDVADNDVDENCSGAKATTYYRDADHDGKGDPDDAQAFDADTPPYGYVATGDDPCPVDAPDDTDLDKVCDSDDNCPAMPNAAQDDENKDGFGDACRMGYVIRHVSTGPQACIGSGYKVRLEVHVPAGVTLAVREFNPDVSTVTFAPGSTGGAISKKGDFVVRATASGDYEYFVQTGAEATLTMHGVHVAKHLGRNTSTGDLQLQCATG